MKNSFKEEMRQHELERLEKSVIRKKEAVVGDAFKVIGCTTLASAGVLGAYLLVPELVKTYTSEEAITFAAVTILRFKESGAIISAISALAGLYGTARNAIELKDDTKELRESQKKLSLKRKEYEED